MIKDISILVDTMSSPRNVVLRQPDGSRLQGTIIGIGRTGVVVRRDNTAVKLPLRYCEVGQSNACVDRYNTDAEICYECIQREKLVYKRLGEHESIVPCLDLSGVGITMALMNGNLRDYLNRHRPPKSIQLGWFRDMARGLIYIHDLRVIVADIAARNFLLSSDLTIKFSDFTESTILPLDTDMQMADDAGYSIFTDIGQLGAVMYETIMEQSCDFDLSKTHRWGRPLPFGRDGTRFQPPEMFGLVPSLRNVGLRGCLKTRRRFWRH